MKRCYGGSAFVLLMLRYVWPHGPELWRIWIAYNRGVLRICAQGRALDGC